MHATLQFFEFWALAFATLSTALVLLNLYDNLIGNDLVLLSVGQETLIAGAASLVEGTSLWLVLTFLPMASRALIFPALIVAFIYKLSHLEDWSRYDVLMLLLFQIVIGAFGGFLLAGRFQTALVILLIFAVLLTLVAALVRNL